MQIAYLLNTYPLPSTTFIRREIAELEKLGVSVHRFAMRRWSGTLVDDLDLVDLGKTFYLLDGRGRLLALLAAEIFANPIGLVRALRVLRRVPRTGLSGCIRNVAYLLEAVRFSRVARSRGIDHVHEHFCSNATTVAMLAHMLGGPTFSFTAHGPEDFEEAAELGLAAKVHAASFVAAISEHARGQLAIRTGPHSWDKLHVVRCGLDLDAFAYVPCEGRTGRNLLCVGRLTQRKGQVLLPRAVADLMRDDPNLLLDLIGDGDTRDDIEAEIVRLGLEGRIRLLGWRSGREIAKAIAGAEVLILPSFAEGLPVVILEALATGCPVISTRVGGIPEVLDERCGWLFPAGDMAALSRAISAALAADRAEMETKGLEGRRRVVALHDIRNSATQLIQLFAQHTQARTFGRDDADHG